MAEQHDVSQPYFTHDCSSCEFLTGVISKDPNTRDESIQRHDVYICSTKGRISIAGHASTIISRHSSEGHDYITGTVSAKSHDAGILVGQAILEMRQWWKEQRKKS